jgi:tetratricopeptide (TPR) repeat protein
MKTLKENENWSVNLKAAQTNSTDGPRPKIGDDDGVSDRTMNAIIVLFTFITLFFSITAGAKDNDQVKYRIMLRQAMLDMDRMEYDKAIIKLLEVRAHTPENANVDHMLGICYLYGENDQQKAVFYLNRAVQHASLDYMEWDLDEVHAPVQTAYHLAVAYENLKDFGKAAEFYGQYLVSIEGRTGTISSRTMALIGKNAERCRTTDTETEIPVSESNVVINK